MTLDEALIIAQRIENDDVAGPVGMALRVLLKAYLEVESDLDGFKHGSL
jgi:hypothetical protein